MNNDPPPSCFFEVNEMGNKESTWCGLTVGKAGLYTYSYMHMQTCTDTYTHACMCMNIHTHPCARMSECAYNKINLVVVHKL